MSIFGWLRKKLGRQEYPRGTWDGSPPLPTRVDWLARELTPPPPQASDTLDSFAATAAIHDSEGPVDRQDRPGPMRYCASPYCHDQRPTYYAGSGGSVPAGTLCCAQCFRVIEVPLP